MRVLTDPAETGAVTLALPQDVQAEACDWPEELFARRVWHVARPVPEPAALERAVAAIRVGAQAAHRRRWRRHLQPGQRRAAGLRRGDGHPGRRDAGRQGRAGLRPPAVRRRDRRHRHDGRQRPRRRGGPRDRRRHPLQRLHDRVAHGVRRATTCGSSTSTCRRSTPTSSRPPASWPTRARACARWPRRSTAGRPTPPTPRGRPQLAGEWDAIVQGAYDRRRMRMASRGRRQSQVIGAVNELSDPRDVVRLRGRLDARRPAQAVAHARPQGLSRRVRLLLHGLRDRRRPRRQAGRARRAATNATCSSWSATAPT